MSNTNLAIKTNSWDSSSWELNRAYNIPTLQEYNVVPSIWREKVLIKTGERKGAILNEKVLQVLWTLVRLANNKKVTNYQTSYAELMSKCRLGCDQRSMARYLKQLKETEILDYRVESGPLNNKKILLIDINFEEFSLVLGNSSTYQTYLPNVVGYIDKNKEENNRTITTTVSNKKIDIAKNVINLSQKIPVTPAKPSKSNSGVKNLKDYHPLSEEDCRTLQSMCGRDFCATAMNEILLSLACKRPEHGFRSKTSFFAYMTKTLRNEKRDEVKTNSINFRIRTNMTAQELQAKAREKKMQEWENRRHHDRQESSSPDEPQVVSALISNIMNRMEPITNTENQRPVFDSRKPERELAESIKLSFGTEAQLILEKCRFNIIPDKVSIEFHTPYSFTDEQKQKIRQCIFDTCGANTKITSIHKLPFTPSKNLIWMKFKNKFAPGIVLHWFEPYFRNNEGNKLLFTDYKPFMLKHILNNYKHILARTLEENPNLESIELRANPDYIDPSYARVPVTTGAILTRDTLVETTTTNGISETKIYNNRSQSKLSEELINNA